MKKALSYFLAAITVSAALAMLLGLHSHLNVAAAGLILVTVVTVCSVLWGSGPGLLAAVIGVTGLNRFTEHMVELAKLQSHQLVIQPEPSSVQEIVEAAASRLENRLRDRTLEISIAPDASHVRADAKLISEVLYNILDNALKYSPSGSRIVVSTVLDGGSFAIFRVEDEGPGIAAALRDEVFQRFYRSPDSQHAIGGLGMGLAI